MPIERASLSGKVRAILGDREALAKAEARIKDLEDKLTQER